MPVMALYAQPELSDEVMTSRKLSLSSVESTRKFFAGPPVFVRVTFTVRVSGEQYGNVIGDATWMLTRGISGVNSTLAVDETGFVAVASPTWLPHVHAPSATLVKLHASTVPTTVKDMTWFTSSTGIVAVGTSPPKGCDRLMPPV